MHLFFHRSVVWKSILAEHNGKCSGIYLAKSNQAHESTGIIAWGENLRNGQKQCYLSRPNIQCNPLDSITWFRFIGFGLVQMLSNENLTNFICLPWFRIFLTTYTHTHFDGFVLLFIIAVVVVGKEQFSVTKKDQKTFFFLNSIVFI